jgi:hypothetical protein
MNDTGEPTTAAITINEAMVKNEIPFTNKEIINMTAKSKENFSTGRQVSLRPYGLQVFQLQ